MLPEIPRFGRSGEREGEDFRKGDTLECGACGLVFVFRKAARKVASCHRCDSATIDRWRPCA